LPPEFNNSSRLAQSTREISEETHQIDYLKGFEHSTANLKNLMNTTPVKDNIPSSADALIFSASHHTPPSGLMEGSRVTEATPSHELRIEKTTTMRFQDGTWQKGWRDQHGKTIEDSFTTTDQFDLNNLGDGTWEAVGPVPSLLSNNQDSITAIIQNHSRSDGIAKKIASYQQRLDAPETPLREEERAKFTNLITAFTAARTYQESMINHLLTSPTSTDPRIARLREVEKLSAAMTLNKHPNKIELLAEKLEQDYKNLSDYQASAQQRQSEIEAEPAPIDITRKRESRDHLLNAITHQQHLINARVTTALLMRPPYEAPNEATQATLSTLKWHSIQYEAEAQRHESLAKVALDNNGTSYLRRAAESFEQVALEAQKPTPNQQSIDLFTQSASLYKEAAEAGAEGLHDKASYLDHAGDAFSEAAREAQKPTPNQQIIDWFTQSASLYKEAAEADAAGLNRKAVYLHNAGHAFSRAAREAQKPTPNQQIIDWFTQSASLKKEAAEAEAAGLDRKASYLHRAGRAFSEAAEEAQKPNAKQQSIHLFTQSASLYQQAAQAHAEGLHDKASYLHHAGGAFYRAAQAAQYEDANQLEIARHLSIARLYELQTALSDQRCIIG
jgi:hypothetical protein